MRFNVTIEMRTVDEFARVPTEEAIGEALELAGLNAEVLRVQIDTEVE